MITGILLLSIPHVTPSSSSVTISPPSNKNGDSNVVFELVGYIKNEVVRTVDGTREMWRNHGRCNEIRAKQRDYREKLKKQWEYEEQGLTPQDVKRRLQKVNGGISYDEFVFLNKGKEDRGKLMNIIFLMWGAPRFIPYAIMFHQEMLPSPLARISDGSQRETKLEKLSRQRSHAVIRTLLAMEKQAKSVPALSKLNIFGRKKQQLAMESMDEMCKWGARILTSPRGNNMGAELILNELDGCLYKDEEFTRSEKRLISIPKPIISGLVECLDGPSLVGGVTPGFMNRGKVITHVQKIAEADEFLVDEKVDLESLSTVRLLEACGDRLIGGPGRTDQELRQALADWLKFAVLQPRSRTMISGQNFNGNVARTALMSFYCVEGSRDERCASFLPRLLFKGPIQESILPEAEEDKDSKKRKR